MLTKVLARRLEQMLDQNVKPNKLHSSWVDCCMIISVRFSLQPNYYTNSTTEGHKCSLVDWHCRSLWHCWWAVPPGHPNAFRIPNKMVWLVKSLLYSYYKRLARKVLLICLPGRHICHSHGLLTSLGRQIKNWADKKKTLFFFRPDLNPACPSVWSDLLPLNLFVLEICRHVLEKNITSVLA